jgi:hypothetical protein
MADYGFLIPELLDVQDIQDTIFRYSLGQDSHFGNDPNILRQWDETLHPNLATGILRREPATPTVAVSVTMGADRDIAGNAVGEFWTLARPKRKNGN